MLEGTPFAARPSTGTARMSYALQQSERDVARLKARVEAVEKTNDRLEKRLAEMEVETRNVGRLRDEMASVTRELQQVRDERTKLRAELTQSMGVTIKKMLDDQQTQTLAQVQKAVSASRPPTPAKQTGYNHTVEAGQTLSLIAREYKTTISEIMRANNLSNADQLRIGMVLFIPEK